MRLDAPRAPEAEEVYTRTAQGIAAAWAAGDADPLSRLGIGAALVLPGRLEAACRWSLEAGSALAALRLASAHVACGGSAALLGGPVGEVRWIQAAEAAVIAGWGRSPAADAEAADRLAELYLAVDPTDSYLHAATWFRRARQREPWSPAGGDGPAFLTMIWNGWFGLARGPGGLACRLPLDGAGLPEHRSLSGIPLVAGGTARVVVEGERGSIEAHGRTWELHGGRTVQVPDE